jgi:hypothetical protein
MNYITKACSYITRRGLSTIRIKDKMKPISEERAAWLAERLRVVDECLKVARASMRMANGVVPGGANTDEYQRVIIDLGVERSKINLELHVLANLVVTA